MRRLPLVLAPLLAASFALAVALAADPPTQAPAAKPAPAPAKQAPAPAKPSEPAAPAGPVAALPTALYGLSWGDPVPAAMTRLEARMPPGGAIYWRESDKLELVGVPVKQILYIYEQGRLAGVSIQVLAKDQAALSAALTRSWGTPLISGGKTEWLAPTLRAVLRPVDGSLADLNVFPR